MNNLGARMLLKFYVNLDRASKPNLMKVQSITKFLMAFFTLIVVVGIVAIIGCFSTLDIAKSEAEEQRALASIAVFFTISLVSFGLSHFSHWLWEEVCEELKWREAVTIRRDYDEPLFIRDLDKELNTSKSRALMMSPYDWDKKHRPGVRR